MAGGTNQRGRPRTQLRQRTQQELDDQAAFTKIMVRLRAASGIDFTGYRENFVHRRIAQQMEQYHFSRLGDYLEFLRVTPEKLGALRNYLLIEVTRFFRDPPAFQSLAHKAIPEIIKSKQQGETIRVWIPGCSTGEEAYSIAICLVEQLGVNRLGLDIRIFGTDVKESVLSKARDGFYTPRIESQMSRERLNRFFVPTPEGYRITPMIRDLCVFGKQDVLSDPPFAKLDLISCRNVLIYFKAAEQERVVRLFNYALRPGGFLMLSRAERSVFCSRYFESFDRNWGIYRKAPE
ncbi:MAG TPA: protein-glutamate O-methyltransferase CheR [Terriglobia bacterium]|nr:protein-glutamate O-methyltransferase CheR [Terriglobia bacterium]